MLQRGNGLGQSRGVPVVDETKRADLDTRRSGEECRDRGPAIEDVGVTPFAEHCDVAVDEGGVVSECLRTLDEAQ